MKLHIKRDWIQKFDHKEKEVEYSAGTALGKNFILNAIEDPLYDFDWKYFPLQEMVKYGWIKATSKELRSQAVDIIKDFFSPLESKLPAEALCRSTFHENSSRVMDKYALFAWLTRILVKAKDESININKDPKTLTKDSLCQLAQLSRYKDGPIKAKEQLAKYGIILIVERHLPKTYLDGAAVLSEEGIPVVGITLRHNRVDNFWFTLQHELVHVWKHLKNKDESFVDDFDPKDANYNYDRCEIEANKYAKNALIPKSIWRRSEAYTLHTTEAVLALADELKIHPAIVAGRIRYENKQYTNFKDIIYKDNIRILFPDVIWE